MPQWLTEIPNIDRNLAFGGLGALLVVLFQLYRALPDVEASINPPEANPVTPRVRLAHLALLALKVLVSIVGGSLVAAFLVRPEAAYGAIIAGMTWTAAVQHQLES